MVMMSRSLFRSFPQVESRTPASRSQLEGHAHLQTWTHTAPEWKPEPAMVTDEQVLDEELLRAGILASLRDAPEGSVDKVEVQKSSVSSLRCVTAYRFHFPTIRRCFRQAVRYTHAPVSL